MEEIKQISEFTVDKNGKKWMDVRVSFQAISQINKIILGDKVDDDMKALREQIHKDCLELFDLFR